VLCYHRKVKTSKHLTIHKHLSKTPSLY